MKAAFMVFVTSANVCFTGMKGSIKFFFLIQLNIKLILNQVVLVNCHRCIVLVVRFNDP